jgi:hypothetical protein
MRAVVQTDRYLIELFEVIGVDRVDGRAAIVVVDEKLWSIRCLIVGVDKFLLAHVPGLEKDSNVYKKWDRYRALTR